MACSGTRLGRPAAPPGAAAAAERCLLLVRRAIKTYEEVLRPILEEAAGMQVTAIQLQHPQHATDIVRQLDLGGTDMLVCVGGDGTLWEGLQVRARASSCQMAEGPAWRRRCCCWGPHAALAARSPLAAAQQLPAKTCEHPGAR